MRYTVPVVMRGREGSKLDDRAALRNAVTVSQTRDGAEAEPEDVIEGAMPRGTTIGRYVVLECIGAGGMGVVYEAYDYSLDRRVALKLVHDAHRTTSRDRLVREARTLAKLSHPNVVTVFEVGSHQDELFVAMELIEGSTVRDWLAEPRPWPAVVAMFRRAGEGLAAAHDAGIVHRDIKPDNLFIDQRGEVRVGDFGVAMLRSDSAATTGDDESPLAPRSLTQTGSAVGTPAYMAPEQLNGSRDIDARADQFGFCVTLYEALHGERPFPGSTDAELVAAIDQGRPVPGSQDRPVPSWLDRVVVRGLAAKREDRYPSMRALLAALGRNPRATALRWSAFGAVLLVVAGGAVASTRMLGANEAQPCGDAELHLQGVWDAPRRDAIHAGFLASGAPGAADTWIRVERVLDDKSRALTMMRTQTCEATHVRGEQSFSMLDLRMECLDARTAELRSLTELFLKPDAATVGTAATAARGLEGTDACANTAALRDGGHQATDPAAPDRRDRLARLRALLLTGKDADVLELGTALVADAVRVGDRTIEASAQTSLAGALIHRRELAKAEDALYQAVAAAEASRDHRVAATAWIDLVGMATDRVHFEEGHRIAVVAKGAIDEIGGDPPLEAKLAESLGVLEQREGKLAASRADFSRAVAILEKHYGADDYRLAVPLQRLAGVTLSAGSTDEAVKLSRRARVGLEKELGPDAPQVVTLRMVEGSTLMEAGQLDAAMAIFKDTLAAAERTHMSDRRIVAMLYMNMGSIHRSQGRNAEARLAMESAIAIHTEVSGAESLDVARSRSNLAIVLVELKRTDEALAQLAIATAIQEKLLGAENPTLAMALGLRGSLLAMNGKPALGLAPLERAVALRTKAGLPCDPNMCYWLARALVATGGDRERAKQLTVDARAAFIATGNPEATAELDAWVATRRR